MFVILKRELNSKNINNSTNSFTQFSKLSRYYYLNFKISLVVSIRYACAKRTFIYYKGNTQVGKFEIRVFVDFIFVCLLRREVF